jgi:hypothetical protein
VRATIWSVLRAASPAVLMARRSAVSSVAICTVVRCETWALESSENCAWVNAFRSSEASPASCAVVRWMTCPPSAVSCAVVNSASCPSVNARSEVDVRARRSAVSIVPIWSVVSATTCAVDSAA